MNIQAINNFNNNQATLLENKKVAVAPNFKGNSEEEVNDKYNKITKYALGAAALGTVGVLGYKGNWVQNSIKWLSKTKWMQNKAFPNYENDVSKFMSAIGVTSIILKDGLGCYLYVKQSLNNKKIPEDKRKFVAALDLANGALMIAMQLLMFFTISSKTVQKKMFNTLFGKNFTRTADKALQGKLSQMDKLKDMTGKEFHKAREANKKGLISAFGYFTSLLAATMLAKRVIVPFIATPLADKTKAWMSRNDKPATIHKDTKNKYDTQNHIENDDKKQVAEANKQEEKPASTNLLKTAQKK